MTAVLIAGGGTGGHLYPGVAVAQELLRRNASTRVLFVGTARGIEATAVPKAGFDLALLPVSGLRRTGLAGFVAGIARLPIAMLRAMKLVRRFRPNVAVSVGGYAAGPAVLAARLLGVRCVVMEQNAVPGITNRLLSYVSHRVVAALPTRGFPPRKVSVLGNPVRKDFLAVRDLSYQPHAPLRLLVFGGSQGARALNEVMMDLVPRLVNEGPAVELVHQTGAADQDRVARAYASAGLCNADVRAFIDDMPSALARADVVLCRAGASTIAELTVSGRPSILVPFPFAAGDHQTINAETLARAGAARHLPQSELTVGRLQQTLGELNAGAELLCDMAARAKKLGKPEAARDIADLIDEEVARV